jgi:hypothetical protein
VVAQAIKPMQTSFKTKTTTHAKHLLAKPTLASVVLLETSSIRVTSSFHIFALNPDTLNTAEITAGYGKQQLLACMFCLHVLLLQAACSA